MRLLGAFCLFFMVGFSTAFDDEEAKLAESVDLHEALEEHYDPENIHDDENEKVERDEEEDADADEESYGSPPPLPPWMLQQKPWWYFLPPWMHPGFMPGAPPLVEEKYMRELDDSEMPDYEIPDDMFPEPEFPPIDYMDLSDDPMEMYPFMDFPPMLDEDDEDEEDETLHRSRREALVDTMTIHDPNEWWHDLDSGVSNAVTKKLARTKTGIASQYMMKDALDHYGPALHLGEIDTGFLRNPELEQASDRTFGKDSDFYLGDMDAFRFTPKGERYQSFKEFKKYKGRMALGRRFILHKLFFNGCETCWINKKLKNVKNVRQQTSYNPNMFVDPLLSHETYWHQISCDNFMPGQYMLLAFKERKGKVYMYFQDQFGRQIAVADPNFNGMQAASPYTRQTAIHSLYYNSDGSKSYYALQPDVSHMNNAAYTHTGGRWGEDELGDYKGYSEYDAPYDESMVWMLNTGRTAPSDAQTNFKQKRYNLNAIDQPTEQYFDYVNGGGGNGGGGNGGGGNGGGGNGWNNY